MPLTSVTADSVPWSAGDSTVIVAPGIDRPSFDVMVPVITPVCRPCATAPEARPATRANAHVRLANTVFIVCSSKRSIAPDTDAGERGGMTGPTAFENAKAATLPWGDMWRRPCACDQRAGSGDGRGAAEPAAAGAFVVQTDAMRPPFLLATAVAITLAGTALPRAQMTTDPETARRLAQAKRLARTRPVDRRAQRHPVADARAEAALRLRRVRPAPAQADVPHRHRPRSAPAASAASSGRFTCPARSRAVRPSPTTLEQIDSVQEMLRRYPDVVRGGPHGRRRRADRQGRPRRLDDGHGGRALDRRLARRAASVRADGRRLHDADPQRHAAVGRRGRRTSPATAASRRSARKWCAR